MTTLNQNQLDHNHHNHTSEYEEDIVILGGNEIDIAHTNRRDGGILGRYLIKSLVYINEGEFLALILLYDSKLISIAVRLRQEGQRILRRYTWTYEQIKCVTVFDNNNYRLIIIFQGDFGEYDVDVIFPSKLMRDLFAFKIRMLTKIYNSLKTDISKSNK